VALARMLANDRPLILADEPTGNLDPQTSADVMDFLTALNKEQDGGRGMGEWSRLR
jgi:ABC-type lipoprotein export system ATPase subunit